MRRIEVHCRCNAAWLALTGEPVAQIFCHCDDCRAAHDAAYVSSSIYPAHYVQVLRGDLTTKVVSATRRLRCAACGTHLFSEIESAGLRSVNAFLLPHGEFTPQFHVQCQHAILPVVDNLPHYKGFPASFGGAEEFVSW